jgi:hypothetical protein
MFLKLALDRSEWPSCHTFQLKVKQSCYRLEQTQRVDRGVALPFCDLCFTPGKDPTGGWVGWSGHVRKI